MLRTFVYPVGLPPQVLPSADLWLLTALSFEAGELLFLATLSNPRINIFVSSRVLQKDQALEEAPSPSALCYKRKLNVGPAGSRIEAGRTPPSSPHVGQAPRPTGFLGFVPLGKEGQKGTAP